MSVLGTGHARTPIYFRCDGGPGGGRTGAWSVRRRPVPGTVVPGVDTGPEDPGEVLHRSVVRHRSRSVCYDSTFQNASTEACGLVCKDVLIKGGRPKNLVSLRVY